MYRNLNLKKLTFTRKETVSKCRHVRKTRKTRRCGGAFTLLTLLVFATAMLLHTPVVRAVQTSVAVNAVTSYACQISSVYVDQAMIIDSPDISTSSFDITSATFIEGPAAGAARLVGEVWANGVWFAVDLILEDRLDPGDTGYSDACRIVKIYQECVFLDPNNWHVYTTLNGTLTGLSGSIFEGVVYNVTLRSTGLTCIEGGANPAVQVGFGANTHSQLLGVFAPLEFVLANPKAYTSLYAGSFSGELSLEVENINKDPATFFSDPNIYHQQGNFPVPSPDLTGTWTGVIECAGMLDFTDVETFSGSMTLKVGPPTGFNYSVELSDAGGNVVATYCAEYTSDLRGGQFNKGLMTNSDTGQSVLLKVKEDDLGNVTLKAREFSIIPDGQRDTDLESDGLDFCKWTFTQTSKANPGIEPVCP